MDELLKLETTYFETIDINRFYIEFDGIPSFLMKGIKLPTYEAFGKWRSMSIELYNSITPSTFQALNDLIQRDNRHLLKFEVHFLGPAEDKVSHWSITGLNSLVVEFGSYAWTNASISKPTSKIHFDPIDCKINY